MDNITVTNVRCARCPKKFTVINIDKLDTFECPHCKGKHVKVDGQWYDEKIILLRQSKTNEGD